MSISKANGNMYDWCSHTHSHLRGKCPHGCSYCYVQAMERRYGGGHYAGDLRLDEKQFAFRYDTPKMFREAGEAGFDRPVVFVEHCNDIGCASEEMALRIYEHCRRAEGVRFVFQSKRPGALKRLQYAMPEDVMVGTTVESDVVEHTVYDVGNLPETPNERLESLASWRGLETFVTVEPIMKMSDPVAFARAIAETHPSFVNIGADSKGTGLVEPTRDELMAFLNELAACGVPVRRKTNLGRLLVVPNAVDNRGADVV